MAKTSLLVFVVFVLGLVLTVGVYAGERAAGDPVPPPPVAISEATNLLTNPSFEGSYQSYYPPGGHPDCKWGPCDTAKMANGWIPWWKSHNPNDELHIINMPEYKPADPIWTDPRRVLSGDAAQAFFKLTSTFEAGFYQQVQAIPGETYHFSIWGHSWSANNDFPPYSGPEFGFLDQKVGIGVLGGTDWKSSSIVWGPPRVQPDEFGLFEVSAKAQSSTITIFTYAQPQYAVKHNDVYWDDAKLVKLDVSGEMTVEPPGGLYFLGSIDKPATITQTLLIQMPQNQGLIWTAEKEAGGTLDFSFTPKQGGPFGQLSVSINTGGYQTGIFSSQLTITSNLVILGSPTTVPVNLSVVEKLHSMYVPTMLGQQINYQIGK